MENITITQITPAELEQLILATVKKALGNQQTPTVPPSEQWFNLAELCQYLPDKPTKATVYGWVSNAQIPCHKGGKKLRFLKSEIDDWLKQGKKTTFAQTNAQAQQFLASKKPKHQF